MEIEDKLRLALRIAGNPEQDEETRKEALGFVCAELREAAENKKRSRSHAQVLADEEEAIQAMLDETTSTRAKPSPRQLEIMAQIEVQGELVTLGQMAELLGCSTMTARRFCERFPFIVHQRVRYYRWTDFTKILEHRKNANSFWMERGPLPRPRGRPWGKFDAKPRRAKRRRD